MKKPETVALLLVDGFRRDYVTPENAPFLSELLARSVRGSIEAPPGFTHRTTLFTGTFPDTSNAFSAFGYAPDESPFRWVSRLGPLAHAYQPRRALMPFRLAVKQISRWSSGIQHPDPAWIPGPLLPHFARTESARPLSEEGALPAAGLFDALRAADLPFRYLAPPVVSGDDAVHKALLDAIRGEERNALFVAQYRRADERGHRHGPLVPEGWPAPPRQTQKDREAMRKEIAEIDRKCREAHDALAATHDRFHLLVVGQHAMAPVMQKVNIQKEIDALGLKAGKDYLLFLDSTLAKLWLHTDRAREKIPAHLEEQPYGRIVHSAERRERRIPSDRRYGDLLFAADPGILFWPNYFHAVEHDVKGMHGYIDKMPNATGEAAWGAETNGLLLLRSPAAGAPRDVGARSLVDVLPTVCALADVEPPLTHEGRSFLEEHAPLA